MSRWNTLTNFTFTILNDFADPCVRERINGVGFRLDFCGVAFGGPVLAVTRIRSSSGVIVETEIVFNDKFDWDIYSGPLQIDPEEFTRVATHELGHALGLGHENSLLAIMAPFESDLEFPQQDDIDGVNTLYPMPVSVAGDLNGDGVVDRVDRSILIGSFGSCTGDASFIAETDYNGTGCTDFDDYLTWYRFYKDFASTQPCEACGTGPSPKPAPKRMSWPQ
jgi:hypothetical protein